MGKLVGAVLVGVVIGAAVSEIIRRQKPDLHRDLIQKCKNGLGAVKDAFKEGYAQASAPAEAAPESVPAS
ncbi:MAG TPA: hypothetical protein VM492_04325 [Sumerlaeia bacterium]|nr:hypothetical protein [Sumerlaeia bacterium]